MYYYAGTIRKLTRGMPHYSHYDAIVKAIKEKYTHIHIEYHYEMVFKINGNHNVHIHFMIKTPKKVMRQMLQSCLPKGYGLWMQFAKSKYAWKAYMTKQDQKSVKDQIDKIYYASLEHESPDDGSEDGPDPDPLVITRRIV